MELTICLLTKGREMYLQQILDSFEDSFKFSNVRVLLLDNGSDASVKVKLESWQAKHPERVKLIRREENDPRQAQLWKSLRNEKVDWVILPSDDDEFRPEIISEWREALIENPDLVAFASSAAIMNSEGKLTGEVITQSSKGMSKIEQVAFSFHEPPFHWPSLFIRSTCLPPELPSSRFAFDWWIGIQLHLAGPIKLTESVGVNYRVHSEQESYLAPLRRKYFEAQIWLGELVRSVEFKSWISNLNNSERIIFWESMKSKPPIYGDPVFSKTLISSIYFELMTYIENEQMSLKLAADFALLNGILLKDGEAMHLIREINPQTSSDFGNISIETVGEVCAKVLQASSYIKGNSDSEVFKVSCNHVTKSGVGIRIDCSKFFVENPLMNADLLIGEITTFCEKRNDFEFTITSGERILVKVLRKVKGKLPPAIKNLLRFLKRKANAGSLS